MINYLNISCLEIYFIWLKGNQNFETLFQIGKLFYKCMDLILTIDV